MNQIKFGELCDDVYYHIFQFLTTKDLFIINQTNKSFSELVQSSLLKFKWFKFHKILKESFIFKPNIQINDSKLIKYYNCTKMGAQLFIYKKFLKFIDYTGYEKIIVFPDECQFDQIFETHENDEIIFCDENKANVYLFDPFRFSFRHIDIDYFDKYHCFSYDFTNYAPLGKRKNLTEAEITQLIEQPSFLYFPNIDKGSGLGFKIYFFTKTQIFNNTCAFVLKDYSTTEFLTHHTYTVLFKWLFIHKVESTVFFIEIDNTNDFFKCDVLFKLDDDDYYREKYLFHCFAPHTPLTILKKTDDNCLKIIKSL